MIITGLLLALSILLLLWKLPMAHNFVLRRPAVGDIGLTVLILVLGLFTATFSGLIAAAIAGIVVSMYFSAGNKVVKHREERVINPDRPRLSLPRPSLPKRERLTETEKLRRELKSYEPLMTYERARQILLGDDQ